MPEYSDFDEQTHAITKDLVEWLRPKHLTIGQIKEVAKCLVATLEFVVLQEN